MKTLFRKGKNHVAMRHSTQCPISYRGDGFPKVATFYQSCFIVWLEYLMNSCILEEGDEYQPRR